MKNITSNFEQVLDALRQGDVIAYPTEGVFGLGCDPDNTEAVKKLLDLKQRPRKKGLILIAASYGQLLPYIDKNRLADKQLQEIQASWPGPVTWVMPASERVTDWLSGEYDTIAVRVSDHPLVQKLCIAFGRPITSTSANLSGQPSCRTTEDVRLQFGQYLNAILEGDIGGRSKPSEIRDARTNKVLREG
jgi:L-threonylcarbamoyladenylate synthase